MHTQPQHVATFEIGDALFARFGESTTGYQPAMPTLLFRYLVSEAGYCIDAEGCDE